MRLRLTALLATLVLAGTAVTGVGSPDAAAAPPDHQPPPNIVLITTDDQSVDELAYMPITRQLIGDPGVTFSDAIAPYPLCCPARATLLTGLFNHNNGVITNQPPNGGYQALEEHGFADQTLPTWLDRTVSGESYESSFIGKFLNGYGQSVPAPVPVPQGWDYFAGGLPDGLYDFFGGNINVLDRTAGEESPRVVRVQEEEGYQDKIRSEWNTDRTLERIDHAVQGGKPFFIWQSELAPHAACYPIATGGCSFGPPMADPQDDGKFTDVPMPSRADPSFNERAIADKPDYISMLRPMGTPRIDRMTEVEQQRLRSLQAVDRAVGRIVQRLQDAGVLDNTLIIFTSDNGYVMGQHRFKGKVVPYEPSLRVPFLMRGPADLVPNPGRTVSETVSLVDVAATVADAAKAERPFMTRQGDGAEIDLDGRSILPIIRAESPEKGWDAIPIEAGDNEATEPDKWWYRGLRTKQWVYVHYEKTDEFELYDRRRDPYQLNNLAYRPTHADTRRALAAKLAELRDCAGEVCRAANGDGIPLPARDVAPVHPDELASIGSATQVVTITAPRWDSPRGTLVAWRKLGRSWRTVRDPFPVLLGRNGLARPGRIRHLRDLTPAGTFRPASAMGLMRDPGTDLSYRRLDRDDWWPFDRRLEVTYSVLQPHRSEKARWRASQALRWAAKPTRYSRVLVMNYNLPRRIVRQRRFDELVARTPADFRMGSFLMHTGSRTPRQGWVSMDAGQMRWLLRWVDPASGTRFVVGTPDYLRSTL